MINAHKLLVSLIERKDASGNSKFIYLADTIAEEVAIIEEAIKYSQEWIDLTDEEIKSLPSWWPSYEDAPALVQLVKDVEAKLKEKNTCA